MSATQAWVIVGDEAWLAADWEREQTRRQRISAARPLLVETADGPVALTRRQFECLRQYAMLGGMSQVAIVLGVSIQTVKNHLSAAYQSLGVHTAIDAFRLLGWLSVPAALRMTRPTPDMSDRGGE